VSIVHSHFLHSNIYNIQHFNVAPINQQIFSNRRFDLSVQRLLRYRIERGRLVPFTAMKAINGMAQLFWRRSCRSSFPLPRFTIIAQRSYADFGKFEKKVVGWWYRSLSPLFYRFCVSMFFLIGKILLV